MTTKVTRIDRACGRCGNTFPMRKRQRFCSKCSKEEKLESYLVFFEARRTRGAMARLAEVNPDLANKIRSEMVAIEGPEFTELAIDGMIEKVRDQKRLAGE